MQNNWCAWSTPSGAENPSSPEISLWRPQNWYGLTFSAPKWMSGIHLKSSGIYDPSPCGFPPLLAHIFPETLGWLDSGSAAKTWIVGAAVAGWPGRYWRIPSGVAVQPPTFTTDPADGTRLSDLSDWVMLAVERNLTSKRHANPKLKNWTPATNLEKPFSIAPATIPSTRLLKVSDIERKS